MTGDYTLPVLATHTLWWLVLQWLLRSVLLYRIARNFRIIKFLQFLQFSQMIDQQRKFSMRKFTTLHHFQLKTGKFYPLINDLTAKYTYHKNFRLYDS